VLQVIGAGFGRTGTASTKAALELLLQQPCYHMFEALAHLDHHPAWLAAAAGDAAALDGVLDGYGATVDWPGCSLWRELTAAYPDARVLLTVRPADRWWSSYAETIHQLMLMPIPDAAEVGPELVELAVFGHVLTKRSFPSPYESLGPADFVAAYERHNAAVRSGVPPDRLLEYDITQGWEPLCDFLGLPVPDEPVPFVNDRRAFRELFGLDGPQAAPEQPYTREQVEGHFRDAGRPRESGTG
jgi:hypothetical protein